MNMHKAKQTSPGCLSKRKPIMHLHMQMRIRTIFPFGFFFFIFVYIFFFNVRLFIFIYFGRQRDLGKTAFAIPFLRAKPS